MGRPSCLAPPGRPICCHCGVLPARQSTPTCTFIVPLCWRCRADPAIRALHPSSSKHARRGIGSTGGCRILPPDEPTTAAPGTLAKIAVLAERASARRALWHPDDSPQEE